jgi:hypothetical protein
MQVMGRHSWHLLLVQTTHKGWTIWSDRTRSEKPTERERDVFGESETKSLVVVIAADHLGF